MAVGETDPISPVGWPGTDWLLHWPIEPAANCESLGGWSAASVVGRGNGIRIRARARATVVGRGNSMRIRARARARATVVGRGNSRMSNGQS